MSLPVFDRSVLENVNPHGRVDVLASNVLRKVAEQKGLSSQFEALRPVVDFGLLYFLGPRREFARAVKTLSAPKKEKKSPRPRQLRAGTVRARRSRREVLEPEIVSL